MTAVMGGRLVEPFPVAQLVEQYVNSEIRDAGKFTNREPLDESGVYDLHSLAARIYQLGFNDGASVEAYGKSERRLRENAKASS